MATFYGGPCDGCDPTLPRDAVAGDMAFPTIPPQVDGTPIDIEVSPFTKMLMESRRINLYVLDPRDREVSGFVRYVCEHREERAGFYYAGEITEGEYSSSDHKLIPVECIPQTRDDPPSPNQ